MAIIAYKNLFPRDFTDLQLNRGLVFTIFNKKEEFIEEKIVQLNSNLVVAKEKYDAAKREHLNSTKELNWVIQNKQNDLNYQSMNYQKRQEQLQELKTESETRKEAIENKNNEKLPVLHADIINIETAIARAKNEALQ